MGQIRAGGAEDVVSECGSVMQVCGKCIVPEEGAVLRVLGDRIVLKDLSGPDW